MKEFVLFSLNFDQYYCKKFSSDAMSILEMFIAEDYYLYGHKFLIDWANDPKQDSTNATITYLVKEDGVVSIGDLYEKEPFFFELPIEKFIKLLNNWKRVTKQKPKRIIISRENDTVIVEGYNPKN